MFVWVPDALQKGFASQHDEMIDTYAVLINLLFQIGRTSRAKYKANPSRLPLNRAVPDPSPARLSCRERRTKERTYQHHMSSVPPTLDVHHSRRRLVSQQPKAQVQGL